MTAVILFYIASKPEFSHCFRLALEAEKRELQSILYTGQVPDLKLFNQREFVRAIDRHLFLRMLYELNVAFLTD